MGDITRRRFIQGMVGVAIAPAVAKAELILPTATLTQTIHAAPQILPSSRWLIAAPNWAVNRVVYEQFRKQLLADTQGLWEILSDQHTPDILERVNVNVNIEPKPGTHVFKNTDMGLMYNRFNCEVTIIKYNDVGEHLTHEFVFRPVSNRHDISAFMGAELTGVQVLGSVDPEIHQQLLSRTQRYPSRDALPEGFKWPDFNEHLASLIGEAPEGEIFVPPELSEYF